MPSQSNPTKRRRADYHFARVRDIAFDAVSELWRRRETEGMMQKDVAEILGRDRAWVSKNLRGPGNWTLRTFGELVGALNGEAEIIVNAIEDAAVRRDNYDAYLGYSDLEINSDLHPDSPSFSDCEVSILTVGETKIEAVPA